MKKKKRNNFDREYLIINDIIDEYKDKPLYKDVDANLKFAKETMGNSYDLITKDMYLENTYNKVKIGVAHIDGLSDLNLIYDGVLESLSDKFQRAKSEDLKEDKIFDYFKNSLVLLSEVSEADTFDKMFIPLLYGDTIIFIEGTNKCLFIGTKGLKERAVEKSNTNTSVKGAKDGFTENAATNIALIRRRVRTPNLWIKKYIIGKTSNTLVAVLYINGKISQNLVDEINKRIMEIKADNILDSSYIIYYLREKQKSIFPIILDTERPDLAAACLFEGRAVIVIDGSPFVVVAPSNFLLSQNSPEDFYQKSLFAIFYRFIRFIAFILALILPGAYICLAMFHSELLPLNLLFSISGQRQGVPIPISMEVLLLLLAFDFLKESGTRMPLTLGSSLSFIGAIIIGQSAVDAGLISSIVVIVVAASAICSLAITDYDMNLTVSVLRYFLFFCSLFLGLLGLTLGLVLIMVHLVSLRSFGLSYLIPFSPFNAKGIKDSVIRYPLGIITDNANSLNKNNPY